jgi:hypothetical protein
LSPAPGKTVLQLYGTGFRRASSLSAIHCTIGGAPATIQYAGPQGGIGLDQLNVVLSPTLSGDGDVPIKLTVDGQTSNEITVDVGSVIFYVSPHGRDSGQGTIDDPFLSLVKAQRVARSIRDSVVVLRDGVYPLANPLTFTAADTNETWQSYPGETPVVTGGRAITGWTPSDSIPGAWQASIDGFQPFEQLWVNGERRYQVRVLGQDAPGYFHNLGPVYVASANGCTNPAVPQGFTPSLMISAGKYECFDRFFFRTGDIDPGWSGLADPRHPIEIIDFEDWTIARMHLVSIGDSAGIDGAPANSSVAYLAGPTVAGTNWGFLPGHRFLIDNVKEALSSSAPGQWYADAATITYVPLDGEDFANGPPEVIAPQASRLFVSTDPNLKNLTFTGLTFSYTNWIAGNPGYSAFSTSQAAARENVPAALSFTHAGHITLDSVELSHLGGWGVEFVGSANNQIINSVITDLGSGAIRIGTEPAQSDTDANVSQSNLIYNNLLSGGDRMVPGVAITIENSHDNIIDHNEIVDFYNQGINLGRALNFDANGLPNWVHGNQITYNLIHDLGQGVTSDLGAVHTATGLQTGNTIANNDFHDISHDPTGNGYGGWGIYLDQGSSFVTVNNNLVYNTLAAGFTYNSSLSGAYQLNGTPNPVSNNIFAFGSQASVHRNGNDGALNFTFKNNIVYWDQTHPIAGQPNPGPPSPQDGTWNCAGPSVTCFDFAQNMYYSAVDPDMETWRFQAANRFMTMPQWQASPSPGEDVGSTVGIDPLFVSPATFDFTLQAGSPATTMIGFQPFDPGQAGRVNPDVTAPRVPPGFPLQVPTSY